MREIDDQHAPDGGDDGVDAVRGRAGDVPQPGYVVVQDAAIRRASALEYQQRIAAAYKAYDAGDAGPRGAEVNHATTDKPQDAREVAVPSGEREDSWPPPQADRDRARKLYSEYLADVADADRQSHRDQGTNEVGSKPSQSPGDISDLPPPGDELIEMESSKKSRFAELFQEAEKEENLDGLHDAVTESTSTVQRWLSARPPEGHAEQSTPTHHPYLTSGVPDHGIEGGDMAGAVLMTGVLTVHAARWIDDKLRHREGDDDDSNR
jgi:hypothetical protein